MPPGDSSSDRRLRRSLLGALALAVVGTAWILGRATPLALDGDARMLLHPLLVDATRQLRLGHLPVWTLGRWGGSPLIADPILGMLYPPYYASYLLTPFPHWRALDVSTSLHLFLLATGVAAMMHRLGAGAVPAVTTAAMIALCPTIVFAVRGWQQYWAALSWWPWLFWAAVTLTATPRVLPAVIASVALAAQVYAGYPEFALYSGLPALAWVVLAPGGRRRLGLVLVVGLGAIALAMPQLLAGLDMAAESMRLQELSGANMGALDRFFSLSPEHWQNVVRTDPPLGLAAPGKLAPAAVVLAVLGATGRGFAPRYLAILVVVFAVLATRDNPLYPLIRVVPPFTFFGAPLKLFYPLSFALLVLAGLGLARLDDVAVERRRLLVGGVGAASAVSFGALPATVVVLLVATGLAALAPPRWLSCVAAAMAFAGCVGFLAATQGLSVRPLFMVPGFIELAHRPPPVVPRPGGRMLALMPGEEFVQAGLNYGALWNVESWNGMADLTQRRQVKVIESRMPGDAVALARAIGGDPVVVVEGSRHVRQFTAAGYADVGRLGTLRFLAAPEPPAPRAVLVPRAKAVTTDEAIAAARFGRALDDRHVLIEAGTLPGGAVGDPAGRLDDVTHERGAVRARVQVSRPTWLVLREPYYRNWRATIDGRPASIYPAGAFMMAVLVEAGTHDVRLVYRERGLGTGLVIAVVGAVLLPLALRRTLPST